MNKTEKNTTKSSMDNWVLPKALSRYRFADFLIQQKASFIFYLCRAMILFMLFILAYTSFLDLNNPNLNGIYLPVILPEVVLLLLFIVCLFILIRGLYGLATHLIIASAFLCVWIVIFSDKADNISRLDTIVFIIALLNITPLFITRYKSTILIYLILNIAALVGFMLIYGKGMGLQRTPMIDYAIDSIVAMAITGILGYNIFQINQRTLTKALTEIEERKTIEKELKESQQLFQTLSHMSPVGIFRTRADGYTTYVNPKWIEIAGLKYEAALGNGWLDAVHPDDKELIFTNWRLHSGRGERSIAEYRFLRPDGSIIWVLGDSVPEIIDNKINGYIGTLTDITEKKKIESELQNYSNHLESLVKGRTEELNKNIEELKATQNLLEKKNKELEQLHLELLNEKSLIDTLMETIPDAIYFKDLESRFVKVSRSMQNNFERNNNFGIIGKSDFDFFNEDHANQAFNQEQEIIRTGNPILELVEKETWKDGRITYASTTKMPLYDPAGKIIGTFGVSRDITKLVEMEAAIKQQNEELLAQRNELEKMLENLQQTHNHLIHAEKMASLGVLAAGIAHEINNPLNFIQGGYIGLDTYFRENLAEHLENVFPLLDAINTGVTRSANIVTSLSHYSRKDDLFHSDCDIHFIIDNCLTMLENQLKNKTEVRRFYTDTPHKLTGSEGKLHQAFLNIIANAGQSIDTRGTITISTQLVESEIIIKIEDTGCGISPDSLDKIFDPFFTTKEPGKGTGLGLSITYKIIQEHNGSIEYESELGRGTKVMIKLPVTIVS